MKKALCFALALVLAVGFSACGGRTEGSAGTTPEPAGPASGDSVMGTALNDAERLVRTCTHVLLAEYAGNGPSYHGDELAFHPVEVWKGEIRGEKIFVQGEDPMLQGRRLQPGDRVILLANRHISVYYSHDIYTVAGVLNTEAADKARVDSLLADAPSPERAYYGEEYADSSDLGEILGMTECAFVVEVSALQDKGRTAPSVVGNCRVEQCLLGEPVYRDIRIVFFQHTVEAGKQYLVLLRDVEGLYTLSSRNSVYPLEEAWEIPELRTMLEKAKGVDAPEEPTEEEILAAERQAAGMS